LFDAPGNFKEYEPVENPHTKYSFNWRLSLQIKKRLFKMHKREKIDKKTVHLPVTYA